MRPMMPHYPIELAVGLTMIFLSVLPGIRDPTGARFSSLNPSLHASSALNLVAQDRCAARAVLVRLQIAYLWTIFTATRFRVPAAFGLWSGLVSTPPTSCFLVTYIFLFPGGKGL
ncbi:hypothetical protein B0T26DRAFT_339848 [Lasiosphaeria miniovina]|uniref:Uncharacterized protein n=1 Tax=Lasiosphaeria miniovina TaxID=1954250 RepID=A0AA40ABA2_9PEZI|nr:uncharacterized protein B0T26DRAFT_339848 [Lasiosphaeria miniovina]KAK0712555.1 hypothetical protein B0T26DRAFT_339848 [Lasiosphaeria miniovina]